MNRPTGILTNNSFHPTSKNHVYEAYHFNDDEIFKSWELFEENGKLGYKDSEGNIVIPPLYDMVRCERFHEPFPVMKDEKWGLIDRTGKQITPMVYDKIDDEFGYPAVVIQDKKYGLLEADGTELTPLIYDGIDKEWGFPLMAVRNGKWGLIDSKGKEITHFIYEDIDMINDNDCRIAKKDGKYGVLDLKGNGILSFIYDDIWPLEDGNFEVQVGRRTYYVDNREKRISKNNSSK